MILDKVDLKRSLSKDRYKEQKKAFEPTLAHLQRSIQQKKISTVIIIEGWDGVGKGELINSVIFSLDPRSFHVIGKDLSAPDDFLLLRKYWKNLPAEGKISIFDRSWYSRAIDDYVIGNGDEKIFKRRLESFRSFEKQLSDSGVLLIKFFFHLSKGMIEERFNAWVAEKERKHYVTELDKKRHIYYDKYYQVYDEVLETDKGSKCAWHVFPASDFFYASSEFCNTLIQRIEGHLVSKDTDEGNVTEKRVITSYSQKKPILPSLDLSKTVTKSDYKQLLKDRQKKLIALEAYIRNKGIPLVLVFEGWDAAGKGGAIKRFIKRLDPRGYQVVPISAPNVVEHRFHYLWRFWIRMPHAGQIRIFDRSWYGRVMVERIEGYCSENEWKRAFEEINQMESYLTDSGVILMKFWIHIDADEQLRRFQLRQEDPQKQWKITDEDWRNREKWDQYSIVVEDMISICDKPNAPWHLIEGNCKYHARIKVIDKILGTFEGRY